MNRVYLGVSRRAEIYDKILYHTVSVYDIIKEDVHVRFCMLSRK